MFIEPQIPHEQTGWIEVICGSMFSGKTEELIRRLKRVKIANQPVQIFKPKLDTRYHSEDIVSHDDNAINSIPVGHSTDMLELSKGFKVVGVDEAQFFDELLPEVCDQLALQGIRVIIAGLDMDYTGKPFGIMPTLLAKAEYVTKVHAICMRCGSIANYSHRIVGDDSPILLGSQKQYEPLCRSCFGSMPEH